jgi:hypothetical protein
VPRAMFTAVACALFPMVSAAYAAEPPPPRAAAKPSAPVAVLLEGRVQADGPDDALRQALLRAYTETKGAPFVVGIAAPGEPARDGAAAKERDGGGPQPSAPAADRVQADEVGSSGENGRGTSAGDSLESLKAPIEQILEAAFLVTPRLLEDRSVRLELGPWLVHPSRPAPADWWSTTVDFSGAELAAAAESGVKEGAARTKSAEWTKALLGRSAALADIGRLHAQSVGHMRAAREEIAADSEAVGVGAAPSAGPPSSAANPHRHPFVVHLGTSSALEIVVWIQSLDAAQRSLRATEGADALEKVKEADRMVADLRALLRALRADGLLRRLDERVPPRADAGASLCASPDWPTDAWELLGAVERGRERLARIRSELLRLAAGVVAMHGLPPEVLERLEERIEMLAAQLPPNLEWTGRIEREVRAHLEDLMDPTAAGRIAQAEQFHDFTYEGPYDLRPAVIGGGPPEDVVGGRMLANRAGWDIYGYLWSGKDALLPSEQLTLAAQHGAILSEFHTIAETYQIADSIRRRIEGDLHSMLAEPWRPWVRFPLEDEAFASEVFVRVREDMEFDLRRLGGESRLPGNWYFSWWGVLDRAFTMGPNSWVTRARNQPFFDCVPFYSNGVGLASKR